jgi:uncharacterized membrane protein YkoI
MNKKTIGMLALGLLLGGGSIGAYQVAAQNNNAAQTPTTVQQQEVQEPSYKGSITVDETKYEGKSEQDESKALAGLAKITADQAKQAAEAQVGGTTSSVELDNENGSLVYEVKIGNQEVKVDAGNGSVLKIEQDDNEKGGDVEKDGIDHQFEGEEEHTD